MTTHRLKPLIKTTATTTKSSVSQVEPTINVKIPVIPKSPIVKIPVIPKPPPVKVPRSPLIQPVVLTSRKKPEPSLKSTVEKSISEIEDRLDDMEYVLEHITSILQSLFSSENTNKN